MLWWFSVFLNKISSLVPIPKRRGRSIDCGVHLTRGDILCLLVTAGALLRDVHVTNYGCYGCYGCYPVVFCGLYHVVSVSCNLFRFETTIWQWGIIRLSWLPKYRACLLLNKRHARAWLPTPRTTFAETWVLVREGRGRKCHPKTRTPTPLQVSHSNMYHIESDKMPLEAEVLKFSCNGQRRGLWGRDHRRTVYNY